MWLYPDPSRVSPDREFAVPERTSRNLVHTTFAEYIDYLLHGNTADIPGHRHFSRVNMRRPDLDRFPRLRYTRPYQCVLGSGDMLYIPYRWWHYMRSHSPSTSQ